jgi:hypothetical protein
MSLRKCWEGSLHSDLSHGLTVAPSGEALTVIPDDRHSLYENPCEGPRMDANPGSRFADASTFGREGRRRVMVVDDNADLARLTSLVLAKYGFDVATVHDGPVAIAIARSFRPHVVLLDIGLPGMDGY